MKHFDLIGRVDVDPVITLLPSIERMWSLDKFRNSATGTPHSDTETIVLRGPRHLNADTIFDDLSVSDWPVMALHPFAVLVGRISDLTLAKPARVMLVKLKAGGHITRHIDGGAYAAATERFHLAITSNDDCVMTIGDEKVNAKPEELWWFDKSAPHEVSNRGRTDRIHLIVDIWKD